MTHVAVAVVIVALCASASYLGVLAQRQSDRMDASKREQ